MKGERKIAGYVKRHLKHQALAAKYQAKLDALLPLKRKVDAALVDLRTHQQRMTGGEMAKAQKMVSVDRIAEIQKQVEVMQGFDNRHED